MPRFLWQSQRWLKRHLKDFDVLHGLAAYHYTMGPAHYAHQGGLPAVVFVAMHRDEFADKSGLKSLLGLPRRRRQMLRQIDGIIAMSRAICVELRKRRFAAQDRSHPDGGQHLAVHSLRQSEGEDRASSSTGA